MFLLLLSDCLVDFDIAVVVIVNFLIVCVVSDMSASVIVSVLIMFVIFSISKLSKVKEEQIRIEQDISVLKKSNEEMMNEKNILNSDEGLEGLARSELGLIKEGETSFHLNF